jgi:hypothetical protein
LKYWSSTRGVVSNLIADAPDFHGSTLAYNVCPIFPKLPCAPAIAQQVYESNFITTLRKNGGDSAYMPTTVIYSLTDTFAQPKFGGTLATSYLLDERNVGVTNNQVQEACLGHIGGSFYTHEGVNFHPLLFALAKDALTNGGPGQVSRLDVPTVCSTYFNPDLSLVEILETSQSIFIAVVSILLYPYKVFIEPPIMSYAVFKFNLRINLNIIQIFDF